LIHVSKKYDRDGAPSIFFAINTLSTTFFCDGVFEEKYRMTGDGAPSIGTISKNEFTVAPPYPHDGILKWTLVI